MLSNLLEESVGVQVFESNPLRSSLVTETPLMSFSHKMACIRATGCKDYTLFNFKCLDDDLAKTCPSYSACNSSYRV